MTGTAAALDRILTQAIAELVPGGGDCAVIGVPDYPNVGDSLIHVGQLAVLKEAGCRIAYVASDLSFSMKTLNRAASEGPVFLQGGGNFGDLWPNLHELRERVVRMAHGRRVVMFPQSVHVSEPARLPELLRPFERHGDCHLLVRDQASFELLSRFDLDVRLCPDAAFSLGSITPSNEPSRDVTVLARADKEGAVSTRPPEAIDWLDRRRIDRMLVQVGATANVPPLGLDPRPRTAERAYRRFALRRVVRGVALLSTGRVLVSDRLHANVMARLLGRPAVVVGDRTGKIMNVFSTWFGGDDLPEVTDNFDAALRVARRLETPDGVPSTSPLRVHRELGRRCSPPR